MTSLSLRSLAVVVVLHDSGDVIGDCLAPIPCEVEVVVVDNASRDDGAARALAARADARILRSETNLGFGGGCNLGWRAAAREVVAFVNPDVRLDHAALAVLLARLDAEPHAMVGPALLDENGVSRPLKARPSAVREALGLLPAAQRWAPAGWDGKLPADHRLGPEGGAVPALEGACFLLRRSDLVRIGGFDERYFLYSEEEDLAARLGALGGRAIFEPRARVLHIGGTSTTKAARFALRHRYRSRVLFYRRRDGELQGRAAAVLIGMAAATSLLVACAKTALGRPTSTTPGFWLTVLAGLWDGVRADPDRSS